MKRLIRIIGIILIFFSTNSIAVTIGVGNVIIGKDILPNGYHINKINIRNILESKLLNIPNIQLVAREYNTMLDNANELQLQQFGLTSNNTSQSFGHWKGATYLVLPAINYTKIDNRSIQYANYVQPRYVAHCEVQISIIKISDNTIAYNHVFNGNASSSTANNNLINDAINNAIKQANLEKSINQITNQKTHNQQSEVLTNVAFQAPSNSTTKINGLLKGSGSFTTQLPLDSVVEVVVTAPHHYSWKQRLKISKNMKIKVNMVTIPKKQTPSVRYEIDINQKN